MPMPTPGQIANRRLLVNILIAAAIVSFLFINLSKGASTTLRRGGHIGFSNTPNHHANVQSSALKGNVIMPKLGNETLKAELGRASWKLFHTTMARFPKTPTEDEQTALSSYIHLFARLYPCGECASHFRLILEKYPPQVSSRNIAAGWACFVHNEVNKSLKKELFDCAKIGDFYDCGCAEDDETSGKTQKQIAGDDEEELVLIKDGSVSDLPHNGIINSDDKQ